MRAWLKKIIATESCTEAFFNQDLKMSEFNRLYWLAIIQKMIYKTGSGKGRTWTRCDFFFFFFAACDLKHKTYVTYDVEPSPGLGQQDLPSWIVLVHSCTTFSLLLGDIELQLGCFSRTERNDRALSVAKENIKETEAPGLNKVTV